ncbi:FecR family protein [Halomonas sp. 86]|uniref:FecR family protein n=1 Tax=unclassified Halomonas TaxID=2609666 RepID=UPI004033CA1A
MKKSSRCGNDYTKIRNCRYYRLDDFIKVYLGIFLSVIFLSSLTANASDSIEDSHRIVLGDTLWGISKRYYGTPHEWPFLQQLNTVSEPASLQPGSMLDLGMSDSFPLTVLYLSGNAWVIENDAEVLLTVGAVLEEGATLQTGRNASITLQMNDGARIVVPSMSRITLKRESEKGVTLFLEEGEIESYVPIKRMQQRPYHIETYNGVLGVRGTHFKTRYESNTLLASVYEGTVSAIDLMVSERAAVIAGKGVRIDDQGHLQVANLLSPPENVNVSSLPSGDLELHMPPETVRKQYRAQIASDPGFLNILHDERTEIGRLRFVGLPSGFYHLRIAAIDELGIEGNSAAHIIHHHSEHVNVSSEDGAWLFAWNHRPQEIYTLQLASDQQFNTILLDYKARNTGVLKVTHLPLGEIYWRILSVDEKENMAHEVGNGILNDAKY